MWRSRGAGVSRAVGRSWLARGSSCVEVSGGGRVSGGWQVLGGARV